MLAEYRTVLETIFISQSLYSGLKNAYVFDYLLNMDENNLDSLLFSYVDMEKITF